MCGRYRLSRRKQLIEEYFDTVSGEDDWNPRYNIAPTQPIWRIVTGNRFLPVIALRTCESGLSLIFGRSWWQ
jgi:putative SOS response-associated peptidase YedK